MVIVMADIRIKSNKVAINKYEAYLLIQLLKDHKKVLNKRPFENAESINVVDRIIKRLYVHIKKREKGEN